MRDFNLSHKGNHTPQQWQEMQSLILSDEGMTEAFDGIIDEMKEYGNYGAFQNQAASLGMTPQQMLAENYMNAFKISGDEGSNWQSALGKLKVESFTSTSQNSQTGVKVKSVAPREKDVMAKASAFMIQFPSAVHKVIDSGLAGDKSVPYDDPKNIKAVTNYFASVIKANSKKEESQTVTFSAAERVKESMYAREFGSDRESVLKYGKTTENVVRFGDIDNANELAGRLFNEMTVGTDAMGNEIKLMNPKFVDAKTPTPQDPNKVTRYLEGTTTSGKYWQMPLDKIPSDDIGREAIKKSRETKGADIPNQEKKSNVFGARKIDKNK
jgi:hypothetical protein